jgi:A/G-specific adenine glycosylase
MLQQTRVETVIPYFERWMARFPTVHALASAPLDAVLKAWEGLGYYARARNLHRTAQILVERYGGELPADRTALLALPGIGRYTVGAILSLAWRRPEPILDGNVRRVLCRIYDVDRDPRLPDVEAGLWQKSTDLVTAAPQGAAGDLNEALMELGALICTPLSPQCLLCPINHACLARQRATVGQRPVRAAKPATPHYDVVAGVVTNSQGELLLIQRPQNGLLGGLWGFGGGVVHPGEPLEGALLRTVLEQTGLTIAPVRSLPFVRHAYTHFKITLHPFLAAPVAGTAHPAGCAAVKWLPPTAVAALALPVTDRKVLELWRNVAASTFPV